MQDVIEYRAAQHAMALFNKGAEGIEELMQSPGQMQLLLGMFRAQSEDMVTEDMLLANMRQRTNGED